MNVAFCIYPLKSGHRLRGVGFYTRNLLENLRKRDGVILQEFENISEVKSADVVHYPWLDLFFRSLPFKKPFPTVVTVHDIIPLLYPEHYPSGIRRKINLNLQKLSLRSCQAIITVSKTSKADIIKHLGFKDKIAVTYESASDEFKVLPEASLLRVKRKFNLPDKFLLYVGDANFNKNLPFLIKGFKKLKEISQFEDLKLILIGGVYLKNLDNIDHPELQSLKETLSLIDEFHLDGEVIRPGHLESEDLIGFYNLATVYIQPSLYEGFGLPLLEAFNCGTPVVCSNIPTLREIGGEAAIYFDPKNLNSFVELVIEVLQSRSLQAKLSKLGLKRASLFSWERTTDETVKVYEKTISR